MGAHASKSSAMGGGGSATVQVQSGNVLDGISNIDVSAMASTASFPAITGSSKKEIEEGELARKSFRKSLYQYMASRDDNGHPISPEIFNGYMRGDAEERSSAIRAHAESLTNGNISLLPEKIRSQIALENAISERIIRFRAVMTSKTSATWWIANSHSAAVSAMARRYVDGKLSAADANAVFGI